MQTRKMSFIESCVNNFIGLILAYFVQVVVFHLYNIKTSTQEDIEIVLIFTVVSIVRSYIVRRAFNWATLYELSRNKELASQAARPSAKTGAGG